MCQHQTSTRSIKGYDSIYLPFALERKYFKAKYDWIWQFVFPSNSISQDPRSGEVRRHHLHESSLQKDSKQAVLQAGIKKKGGLSHISPQFCYLFIAKQ
jgi:hypothetical protein